MAALAIVALLSGIGYLGMSSDDRETVSLETYEQQRMHAQAAVFGALERDFAGAQSAYVSGQVRFPGNGTICYCHATYGDRLDYAYYLVDSQGRLADWPYKDTGPTLERLYWNLKLR